MNTQSLTDLSFWGWMWHKTAVPVFLERFLLPVCAALVIALILTNPMKFDRTQQTTAVMAVIFIAYFTAHTVHLHNQESKQQQAQPAPTKKQPEKSTIPETQPKTELSNTHRVNGGHRHGAAQVEPSPVALTGFSDGQRVVLIDKLKKHAGSSVRMVQVGADPQANIIFAQLNDIFEQAGWSVARAQVGQVIAAGVNFPSRTYMTGGNMSSHLLSDVFSDFASVGINLPITPEAYGGPASMGPLPEVVIVVR